MYISRKGTSSDYTGDAAAQGSGRSCRGLDLPPENKAGFFSNRKDTMIDHNYDKLIKVPHRVFACFQGCCLRAPRNTTKHAKEIAETANKLLCTFFTQKIKKKTGN